MASATSLQAAWSILTELDVSDLRASLHQPFPVTMLGRDAEAREWLVQALHTDPLTRTTWPISPQVAMAPLPLSPEHRAMVARSRLIFLIIQGEQDDLTWKEDAIQALHEANPHLPIIVAQRSPGSSQAFYAPLLLGHRPGITEIILDPDIDDPFDAELVPLLKRLAPDQEVLLGYHFPGLRPALARQLIRQTSLANAGYAAATGVAEIIPIFLLPGNVADFVILTKNQALMAYKIALLMGNDIPVQEMIGEIAGVLGGGYLFREAARRLVGFLPGWGLVPKVAIAYAGTYLMGEATFYWYAYHEKLTAEQMKALYARALTEGKEKADEILAKARRHPTSDTPLAKRRSLFRR